MFSYSDPSLGIIWIDTNGLHDAASLAAFLAAADFATVTKIVLPDSETLGHRPITSVTGLDSFPLLNWLILGGCSLTTIDVSQNPQLTQLELDLNFLTALDVTQNPLLIYLSFTQNGLTSVDLSNNRLLINLYAEQNSLFSASVDDILCKLDSYGLTNADAQSILGPQARAFVTLQGNSLPSMVGQACAERLVSKGWQVTTNLGDNQAPLWPPTTLPPLSNTGSGPGSGQPKLSTNGVLSNPRICGVGILVTDCPGSDSPILNFSSESPDRLFFFGTGYTPFNAWSPPRLGEQYTAPNCLGVEFSVASQEIANLIARLNPVICLGNSSTPTTPGTPVVRRVPFYNTAQAASGGCSSQATFNFVVQPGLFVVMAYPAQYAGAQAQVDAQAQAYAQQQVVHYDFCADCTDPLNLKACVGGVYSSTNLFVLKGSPGNANWTSSGLPPGIHLSPGTTTGVTDASGDSWVRTGANRWTNLTTGASQANAPQGTNSSTTGTADLLGVPTQPGNYNFTVTATASNGNSSTWHGTFSVLGFSNFSLAPASSVLPNGSICNAYNFQLNVVGGTPPYVFWDVELPHPVPYGLNIVNGAIYGATSAGNYNFTLGVRDSLGQECTQLFVLTIDPSATQPSISTASALPNGHENNAYYAPIAVAGGCPNPYASPPYTMQVVSGSLPPGFQVAYSGGWEVFGYPGMSDVGNWSFSLKATDWAGQTVTKAFTLAIGGTIVVAMGQTNMCLGSAFSSSNMFVPSVAPVGATWGASGLPPGISLVPGIGEADLTGTPSATGLYHYTVMLTAGYDETSTQFNGTISVMGFLNTSPLPDGSICSAYSDLLQASGGTGPYTFSVDPAHDPLPTGLSIHDFPGYGTFLVSSVSIAAGTYNFTLIVTDHVGQACSRAFTLTINPSSTQPSITTASPLPDAYVEIPAQPYYTTIVATGGCTPCVLTLDSGTLPANFTFTNGYIIGWPVVGEVGLYNFTVKATDWAGQTVTKAFALTVKLHPVVWGTNSPLPDGSICSAYNLALSVSGGYPGTPPYTFAVDPFTSLPTGLTLVSGVLNGVVAAGTYSFTLIATDSIPQSVSKAFSLTINPSATQPSFTTSSPLPTAHPAIPYSETIVATGGCQPCTFTVDSGTLPGSLSLSSAGVISGTPLSGEAGAYSFTLKATDWAGQTVTKAFALTVSTAYDVVVTGACANNPAITSAGGADNISPPGGSRPTAGAEMTAASAIADLITNLQGLGCNCPPIQVSVDPMGPHTTFTNTSGTCTIVMTTGSEYGPITLLPGGVFDLYNYAHFTIGFDASGPYTFGLGGGVSIVITY